MVVHLINLSAFTEKEEEEKLLKRSKQILPVNNLKKNAVIKKKKGKKRKKIATKYFSHLLKIHNSVYKARLKKNG